MIVGSKSVQGISKAIHQRLKLWWAVCCYCGTVKTNVSVYNDCVICTCLSERKSRKIYAAEERRLYVFYMRSLRKLLEISWTYMTLNTVVLSRCGLSNMFTILCEHRLCWLRHIWQMKKGRILYRELITGKQNLERPELRYWDVCKCDMKELKIDLNKSEVLVIQSGEVTCKPL